jgi:hypothetical protein
MEFDPKSVFRYLTKNTLLPGGRFVADDIIVNSIP